MLTILLVEDLDIMRSLIRDLFAEEYDIEILEAETLTNAMRLVRTELIDLIILDLALPDCEGKKTARKLAKEVNPEIPIIVLSAQIPEEILRDPRFICLDKTAKNLGSLPLRVVRILQTRWKIKEASLHEIVRE